jgi:thiamine-phosphate pyrophosphorylase
VTLPRLLVLTDRAATATPLVDVVAAAVDGGARAVVLRERDLDADERARLADELRALLDPVDGLLVLAGPGADAVHLNASEPVPDPRPRLVGRSCHDDAEVKRAAGCDWITLSPWAVSASKPGYGPPLGPDRFAALAAGAPPTYALGGVDVSQVPACLAAGAYGVAVMGAVMRAEHPDRVVADLLAEL